MRSYSSSSTSTHGFGPSDDKTEPDVTEFSMPSFELKFDWISNVPQHSTIKNHAPSPQNGYQSDTVVGGLAASGKSNLRHSDISASLVDEVANSSLHGNVKAKKAVSIVGVASRRGYRFDGNESDASQKPGSRALKPSVDLAASNTSKTLVDVAAHAVQKKPVNSQQQKPSPSLVSKTMQDDQEANPAHHKQEKEGTYLRGHTCGNTTTWVASAKKDRPTVAPPNFAFLANDGVYAPRLTAVSRTVIDRSVPTPQIASDRDLKAQGAGESNGPKKSHARQGLNGIVSQALNSLTTALVVDAEQQGRHAATALEAWSEPVENWEHPSHNDQKQSVHAARPPLFNTKSASNSSNSSVTLKSLSESLETLHVESQSVASIKQLIVPKLVDSIFAKELRATTTGLPGKAASLPDFLRATETVAEEANAMKANEIIGNGKPFSQSNLNANATSWIPPQSRGVKREGYVEGYWRSNSAAAGYRNSSASSSTSRSEYAASHSEEGHRRKATPRFASPSIPSTPPSEDDIRRFSLKELLALECRQDTNLLRLCRVDSLPPHEKEFRNPIVREPFRRHSNPRRPSSVTSDQSKRQDCETVKPVIDTSIVAPPHLTGSIFGGTNSEANAEKGFSSDFRIDSPLPVAAPTKRSKISSPSPSSDQLKFEELTLKTKEPTSAPLLKDETLQSKLKAASNVDCAKPSPFKFKFQSALGNAPNWAKKTGRGPSTISSLSTNKINSGNQGNSATSPKNPLKIIQDEKQDNAASETSETAAPPRPTTPVNVSVPNAKDLTSYETPVKAESSATIQKLGMTLHRVPASPSVSKGFSIVGRAKRDAGASEKLTLEREESLKTSLPKPANEENDEDLAQPQATSMPHDNDSKLNDVTSIEGPSYRAGIVSGNTTTWVSKAGKQERPVVTAPDFVFLAGGVYNPGMTTASRNVASSESNAVRKPVKDNVGSKGRGGSTKLQSGSRDAVLAGNVIGGNSASAGYGYGEARHVKGYGGYSGSGGANARVGYKSDSMSGRDVRGGLGGASKGGSSNFNGSRAVGRG
ncbi:hypothetical protein HDU80_003071 [Chytriomyces hyalinus]|nr:hypothetical protein HDU80_003071 [Chytriomyces hyalinus]